ncbi:GTP-binding protein [Neisseria sp. Ec49-e6-T10]|uniref:GTP-binding protein n=1 Tax=Neisseria sp. Ec49-e6-T10 TaxID=3140744 RepID=UPI003EC0C7C8
MTMDKYKVLFAGDVGAGKTTAIGSISDIPPIYTDVKASDAEQIGKTHTTVAFDYGEVNLPYLQNRLRLYGLPGQTRFSFIWEMLCEGMLGTIILANNSKPNALEETQTFIQAFNPFIQKSKTAIILGITKTDIASHFKISDYYNMLSQNGICAPIFSIDAREKGSVLLLIDALLSQIEAVHIMKN